VEGVDWSSRPFRGGAQRRGGGAQEHGEQHEGGGAKGGPAPAAGL
jgi:hypothetical protein